MFPSNVQSNRIAFFAGRILKTTMYCNTSRFRPAKLYFLALICVTVPFIASHETETLGWNSLGKEAMGLTSLFSKMEMEKLSSVLKSIPPAELQKVAGRVLSQVNAQQTEFEKRSAILKAMKNEGLFGEWKENLDNLLFDDNALPVELSEKAKQFQSNLKCNNKNADGTSNCKDQMTLPENASAKDMENAVHEMLGNAEPAGKQRASFQDEIDRNDVDFLFQEADEVLEEPPETLRPPKPTQEIQRGETIKKHKKVKQEEPLGALVGMAKKMLGQDASDPTLDIVANMASAYIQSNMDNSRKAKPSDSGPDLGSLLQLASLFSNTVGKTNSADNPLQTLTSLLSNSGMDMNQLLQMGSALMNQGNQGTVSRRKDPTSPIVELLIRLIANFLEMDSAMLLNYYNGLTKVIEAESWDDINRTLRRTTGTNVESMLDMMANDDVRWQLADSAATTVVHWMQHFFDPTDMQTRLMYLNALLMQYNYPPVDPKNVLETLTDLIERLIEEQFSTHVDLKPYVKQTEKQFKSMLHLEPNEPFDFGRYNTKELTMATQRTIKGEMFDPLAELWSDFRLASRFPKCAQTIVCRRNAPSSGRSAARLKQGITRAMR